MRILFQYFIGGGGALSNVILLLRALARHYPHDRFDIICHPTSDLCCLGELENVEVITYGGRHHREVERALLGWRDLSKIVAQRKPDVVWSLNLGAYVRLPIPHILSIHNAHQVYPWEVTRCHPANRVHVALLRWFFRKSLRTVDGVIVQTEIMEDYVRKLPGAPTRYAVIPKAVESEFDVAAAPLPDSIRGALVSGLGADVFTFLYVSTFTPHKNHTTLIKAFAILADRGIKARAVVTVAAENLTRVGGASARRLIESGHLVPTGWVKKKHLKALYDACDACLMPSVLESLSSAHLEAMQWGKPQIVADLPYARDLCRDAALYAAAEDADDWALKICSFLADTNQRSLLVKAGYERMKSFPPTWTDAAIRVHEFFEVMLSQNHKKSLMNSGAVAESRVLLLGFTVPQDVIERICRDDRFMPMQTHNFAWSIVHSLEINGANVDLVSSQPVGNYPSYPKILFGFARWNRGNGSWNVMIPFINLVYLKHITRFFASLYLVVWWVIQTRHEQNRSILLHGVHSSHMYAALAIRQLCRVKVVTIVTDPPGVDLPGEGFFIMLFRRLDVVIIKKALKSMDGIVTLTKQLAKHYAPQVPSIVVEGIFYAEDVTTPQSCIAETPEGENRPCFIILYAGALRYEYGVDLLLKAFSLINDASFRLWILGNGDLADQIQTASNADERIIFKGYCSRGEVRQMLTKAAVLINPRPSNQSFTQFSFPSKTIEYMASGRPVISTRLPGIPEEYSNYLYYLEDESPEGLAQMLMTVSSKSDKELKEFGARARDFVVNNKNYKIQGKRILEFLHTL